MSYIERPPHIKISPNIGSLLDIPVGRYHYGPHGESIFNGGLAFTTGLTSNPNSFKSTLMHYMTLSAANRMYEGILADPKKRGLIPNITSYDTEYSMHESRILELARNFSILGRDNLFSDEIWVLTDRSIYPGGNTWFDIYKTMALDKRKSRKDIHIDTPFLDRDHKTLMKMLVPTFVQLDSLTEFKTDDIVRITDKVQIGDSDRNALNLRQGLVKAQMIQDMVPLANTAYQYSLITAHIGKDNKIGASPATAHAPKRMQHLPMDDKIKGVTDEFLYLMGNCWYLTKPTTLWDSKKAPLYPKDQEDRNPEDVDLITVNLKQIRGKGGPSGIVITQVISQREGVLPELTEFHYLRRMGYGFEGDDTNYRLHLRPDLNLNRTTIRGKIAADPLLRRALNITAELCQITQYHRAWGGATLCSPKELFQSLKDKGYDWDELLSTRGWWCPYNDKHSIPFLSTMDLLKIRSGEYTPYWKHKEV